jgi:hypothetical protein
VVSQAGPQLNLWQALLLGPGGVLVALLLVVLLLLLLLLVFDGRLVAYCCCRCCAAAVVSCCFWCGVCRHCCEAELSSGVTVWVLTYSISCGVVTPTPSSSGGVDGSCC